MHFSPNLLAAQRSGRGPSETEWEDGNPAASNTSQAGLTTTLWVSGRQAAGLAAGGIPKNEAGNLPPPPTWCVGDVKESPWCWALLIRCLESGWGQGFTRGNVVGLSPGLCSSFSLEENQVLFISESIQVLLSLI